MIWESIDRLGKHMFIVVAHDSCTYRSLVKGADFGQRIPLLQFSVAWYSGHPAQRSGNYSDRRLWAAAHKRRKETRGDER